MKQRFRLLKMLKQRLRTSLSNTLWSKRNEKRYVSGSDVLVASVAHLSLQSVIELLKELAGVQAKVITFKQRFGSNAKAAAFATEISNILTTTVAAVSRSLTTMQQPAASAPAPPPPTVILVLEDDRLDE